MLKCKKYISFFCALFLLLSILQAPYGIYALVRPNDTQHYAPTITDIGPNNYWPSNVSWTAASSGGVTISFTNTSKGHRVGMNINKTVKMNGMHVQFDHLTSSLDAAYFAIFISNSAQADYSQDPLMLIFTSNNSTGTVSVSSDTGNTSQTVISGDALKFSNLRNICFDIGLEQNTDGSYTLKAAGLIGTIPLSFITGSSLLTNPDSCYLTFASWTGGATSFSIDFVSLHGGDEDCFNLTDAEWADISAAVQPVENAINSIGSVNLQSGTAISNARSSYQALNLGYRNYVSNFSTLVEAEDTYSYLQNADDTFLYTPVTADIGPSNWWPSNVSWSAASGGVNLAFTNTSKGYRVGLNINRAIKMSGLHITFDNLISGLTSAYFTISISNSPQGDPYTQDPLIFIFTSNASTGTVAVSSDSGATSQTVISNNDALKFTNFRDHEWDFRLYKNFDSSYTLQVAGLTGTIPASFITNASLLTNQDSCYVTFGSWTAGSTTFSVDVKSLHGGESDCYDDISLESWTEKNHSAREVADEIFAIGTVNDSSRYLIDKARTDYNNLSEYLKTLIMNYSVLTQAESDFNLLCNSMDYQINAPTTADIGPNNWWPSNVAWTAASGGGVNIAFTNTSKGYRVGMDINHPVNMDGLHIRFDNLTSGLGAAYFAIALSNSAQGDPYTQDPLILIFTSNGVTGSVEVSSDSGATSKIIISNNDALKFNNLRDIGWDMKLIKNLNNSYTLTVAGQTGIIPASYISNATLLTNAESCYAVLSSWTAGSTSFSVDVKGIHGSETDCYGFVLQSDVNSVNSVISKINNIGTVTEASFSSISDARNDWVALGSYLQRLVTNTATLVSDEDYLTYLQKSDDTLAFPPSTSDIGPNNWWPSNVAWSAASGGGVNLAFTNTSKGYRVGMDINHPINMNGLHIRFDNLSSTLDSAYFAVAFSNSQQGDPYTQDPLIVIFTSNGSTGTVEVSSDSGATSQMIIANNNSLKFTNLKDISWELQLGKNADNSYTLTVAGLTGTIPSSYITNATLLTNPQSCYAVLSSWSGGSTSFSIDVKSLHGGESVCYDTISYANWLPLVQSGLNVMQDIYDVGTVTEQSGTELASIREDYNALSSYSKTIVVNETLLSEEENAYQSLISDVDYRVYAPTTADIGPNNWWPSNVSWAAAETCGVTISFTNTSKGHRVGLNINKTAKMDGLDIQFSNLKSSLSSAYFAISISNTVQADYSQDPLMLIFTTNNSTGTLAVSSDTGTTSETIITGEALKFSNLKDIKWNLKLTKNTDNSYTVKAAGLSGVISASHITNSSSLTQPDTSYVTFASWAAGGTTFSVEVKGSHGGNDPCYGSSYISEVGKADAVNSAINSIDIVTPDSKSVIEKARELYDALPEYNQKMVHFYSTLTARETEYKQMLPILYDSEIITANNELGIRYYTSLDTAGITEAENQGYTFIGCGTVMIPKDMIAGIDLLRSTTGAEEVYFTESQLNGANEYESVMGGTALKNLAKGRDVIARSFIIFEKDGKQIVSYTDPVTNSIYGIAIDLTRTYLLEIYDIDSNGEVTASEKERAYNLVLNGVVSSRKIDNSDVTPDYVADSQVVMEASDSTGQLTSPDWVKSLVMTEVRIEKATTEGTFQAATGLLDFYQEMGINAIWLTPIYDPGTTGNGYGNMGLNTVNPRLTGTTNYTDGWQVVANFVTAAHNRNIRVFLDVITWGTVTESPLYTQHPTWYNGDAWGGKRWNWSNNSLKSWFKTQAQNIITTTDIDGFRCDCEPEITGYGIFDSIRDTALTSGHKIAIFAEGNCERRGDYDFEEYGVMDYTRTWVDGPVAAQFTDPKQFYLDTYNIVQSVKNGTGIGTQTQQNNGTGGTYRFYSFNLSNHDYGRTTVNSSSLAIGYQAIFAPFIPIWYMGEEFGQQYTSLLYNMQLDMSLLSNAANQSFCDQVKKMVRIRRKYPEIFQNYPLNHRTTNICSVTATGNSLQSYARFSSAYGEGIIIIPNNSISKASFNVTIPFSDMAITGYNRYVVTNLLTTETIVFGSQTQVQNFLATVDGNSAGAYLVKGSN